MGNSMRKIKLIIYLYVILSGIVILAGCSRESSDENGIVETITGKSQMNSYKKAKGEIESINSILKKRYDETD